MRHVRGGPTPSRRALLAAAVALWAALPGPAARAGELTVGVFASLGPDHPFWVSMRAFQEAAGADLGLKSRWYFANSDQLLGRQQIRGATSGANPVRGAMITDFKAQGPTFLRLIAEARVPTITFVGFDLAKTGRPRERTPYWIGAIAMDEERVGHALARALLDEAARLGLRASDGRIHVVAISGDVNSSLAAQREQGLRRAIAERGPGAVLEQVVQTTDWSEAEARDKSVGLFRRYPAATVVWSANDAIALGVLWGARASGRAPGKDVVTGGVDWAPEALRAVVRGEMVCSIGGLQFQAGWASLLLYDYLNGRDFAPDVGTVVEIPFAMLTRRDAAEYLKLFGGEDWRQVNFSRLSKVKNPGLKHYDFSLATLLAARRGRPAP